MKNKYIYLIVLFFIFISKTSFSYADPFNIKASEINFQNDKNLLTANGNVEVIADNGIKITGDKLAYDKLKEVLKISGNIILNDEEKNLKIYSENIIYEKKIEKITFDNKNQINFNEKFSLNAADIIYLRNEYKISSNKKSTLTDNFNNIYYLKNFVYFSNTSLIQSKGIILIDSDKNRLRLKETFIDLKDNKFAGKDVEMEFNNLSFKEGNEPRLKANSIISSDNITSVSNGVFTTCKKNDTCPPWSMSAEKINHNKEKKQISYKNAWLKIYDQPILYFPKFFHPDPTVKRQSGFLIPAFKDSTNFGTSLTIPYYKVIAENIDLTFKPRVYNSNDSIIQTEYRHVTKKSDHILDFSVGILDETRSHFFTNSLIDLDLDYFDASMLEVNLEQTSNNDYLKNYKIYSPLIANNNNLNSNIKFSAITPDLDFDVSMEVYENLSKEDTDKYEYVFPSYNFSKLLSIPDQFFGQLEFSSSGYSKLYNTNNKDNVVINDLNFSSFKKMSQLGLQSSYQFILKNLNTSSKNSDKYDDKFQNGLASAFMYELEYPLKKEEKKGTSFLKPKLQARISPSNTTNINYEDVGIDGDNIFLLNRIGNSHTLEGGQSLTLGTEYTFQNNNNETLANFNLASIFRAEVNEDLPFKSGMGNKRSDIIGKINLTPNEHFKFNYDFSIDNNFDKSNYDLITTEFSVNNFVTTFEYLNEDNEINQLSTLFNKTSFNFDGRNSLSFSTRRNRKLNLTEFYNLIYEYQNDCLTAAIEYNREYYTDIGLKPEEQLFFSITIVPFGKANSPNLNK